ncbi:hypothetical protein [Mycobacterium sp.]|uniref:hypothetical protein n=1 Tax=Mycobacterium sp. TaxID=1785 RepID=UPI0031D358EF
MAPETLRVDAERLAGAGRRFLAAADSIPQAPAPYVPTGGDALSSAIAAQAPKFIAPVAAGLPALKANTTKFGQNVLAAARAYQDADQQHAAAIDAGAAGIPAPGGGSGVGGAAGAAAADGSAGAGGMGEFAQLMQMPMETAAQIPIQVAGMAGALPQALMQGLQEPLQQVSQVAQTGRSGGGEGPGETAGETLVDDVRPADDDPAQPADDKDTAQGAGPGRVPRTDAQLPTAPPAQAPASPRGHEPGKYRAL